MIIFWLVVVATVANLLTTMNNKKRKGWKKGLYVVTSIVLLANLGYSIYMMLFKKP